MLNPLALWLLLLLLLLGVSPPPLLLQLPCEWPTAPLLPPLLLAMTASTRATAEQAAMRASAQLVGVAKVGPSACMSGVGWGRQWGGAVGALAVSGNHLPASALSASKGSEPNTPKHQHPPGSSGSLTAVEPLMLADIACSASTCAALCTAARRPSGSCCGSSASTTAYSVRVDR